MKRVFGIRMFIINKTPAISLVFYLGVYMLKQTLNSFFFLSISLKVLSIACILLAFLYKEIKADMFYTTYIKHHLNQFFKSDLVLKEGSREKKNNMKRDRLYHVPFSCIKIPRNFLSHQSRSSCRNDIMWRVTISISFMF